jgi:hypothetical protein
MACPNSGHASLRHSHPCSGPASAWLAGWPHDGQSGGSAGIALRSSRRDQETTRGRSAGVSAPATLAADLRRKQHSAATDSRSKAHCRWGRGAGAALAGWGCEHRAPHGLDANGIRHALQVFLTEPATPTATALTTWREDRPTALGERGSLLLLDETSTLPRPPRRPPSVPQDPFRPRSCAEHVADADEAGRRGTPTMRLTPAYGPGRDRSCCARRSCRRPSG